MKAIWKELLFQGVFTDWSGIKIDAFSLGETHFSCVYKNDGYISPLSSPGQ